MENEEKILTPEESLQIISQTITNTRRKFKSHSYYFLLWGWIVIVASLLCFAAIIYAIKTQQGQHTALINNSIWGVACIIGWAFTIKNSRKNRKITQATNQFEMLVKNLWIVSGIGMVPIIFICARFHFYPAPIILLVLGLSTIITGLVIKFRPIIIGGFVLWIFSIVCSFIVNEYQLLLYAFAVVFGNIIPGYMLKYSDK
jgi:hypothetical protein